MKDKSVKRPACFDAFSRDHGIALVCAQYGRKAIRAPKGDRLQLAEQMRSVCRTQITKNLEDEQWILSPMIGDDKLRAEFHQRHRDIRDLTDQLYRVELSDDPGLGLVARVANALDDYVRWEENTLYPRVAEGIEKNDLRWLSQLTSSMEKSRKRSTQQLHRSTTLQQPSGLQVD